MHERILIDPQVHHGQPVIRGTRVPVVVILGGMAGGAPIDEIMREYDLSEEDILAALSYAAEIVDRERHAPSAG
ncbi:MAG: DUF433 domain-containing protein [Chloroflexi bacterium]|nr:DUF433 domain-containing protein [Chloroflexota bacterium]